MQASIAHSLLVLACCVASARSTAVGLGDAGNGQRLLAAKGCAACHQIGGIAPPKAVVGPSLDGVAANSYIAGILPNTRSNMVRWITHPQSVHPGSAMPELGISEQEAEDMAAYLYEQEDRKK